MSNTKSKKKSVSRRGFLKGAAVVAGSGLIAGSTSGISNARTKKPAKDETAPSAGARVKDYCGEGDWLGTPPIVPESKISKTVDVDVLVLGGAHAGLLAAIGASDKGAKVAVIEKRAEKAFDGYWGRLGEDIGHVNSKWLISRGYGPYDTGEVVDEFVKRAAGRCNPDVIRLFVQNSGAMFDRMVEIYEEYEDERKANDSEVKYKYNDGEIKTYDFSNIMKEEYLYNQVQKDRSPKDYPIETGGFKTWPCVAMFQGPVLHKYVPPFVSVLRWFLKYHVKKTIAQGTDWYYETSAVLLTQDSDGAVTGAIVQDKDKKYIRFNARKGVIVATGGFANNPDMAWALLNESMEWAERGGITKDKFGMRGVRDGYGHKLCCWAGGMIEPTPRGSMALGGGVSGPWGMAPMVQLNSEAKRFANEAAVPLMAQEILRQPRGKMCLVTDKKYMKSIVLAGLEHGGPNFGRSEWLPDMEEDMAKVMAAGKEGFEVRGLTVAERNPIQVYGANTLEELAGYLGYEGDPAKTFVESIKHYNELCYAGADSDFGKDKAAMIPIDEAPFYGCKGENKGESRPGMVTMSGMMTDASLRVLNKDMRPIKGLYAAGNTLGGRYGLGYSTPFAGNSLGMAWTHGWLAGRFAAESV